MKNTKLTVGLLGLCSVVLAGPLLCGCAGPLKQPSKYMTASSHAPTALPPGKVLVYIQRPRNFLGCAMYAAIWEDTKFIGDLGNGNSLACVCEPGRHYFTSTSLGPAACVETQLLPDKTYDLWVDQQQIKPLKQNNESRRRVAEWTQQNRWVEPASSAASYEQARKDNIQQFIDSFTTGKRQKELQHLAAEDYR
jgi:hypothetical protein